MTFGLDMVADWASKLSEDIYKFVPFSWRVSMHFKQCEMICLINQYNWIDCSGPSAENGQLISTYYYYYLHF